jgi:Flp pilus assembly protein TadD
MKSASPNHPSRASSRPGSLQAALLFSVAAILVLGGCTMGGPRTTGSIAATAGSAAGDPDKAVAYWGPRYDKNPKNKEAALNYAAALRQLDRKQQSVAVLQKAVLAHPDDKDVLAAFGKTLAANGQLDQALNIIRRAQQPDRPDWRLISAEAAILDQQGKNDEARKLYVQAQTYAPEEPSILSNLGMSYLLTGDLDKAEETLRKASALPGADGRVRQNLALAVGLQGRFGEAEKIASADLSPEQAAANVAYLKNMLAQQNNWSKLKAADAKGRG